jgi:hypothetical protein
MERSVSVLIVLAELAREAQARRCPPRGLGRATATTSATFFPHCEQRIRVESAASVTDLPASRASASGSMCREVPQGQVTRTRKSPSASSSFLMWGSTPTGASCATRGGPSTQDGSARCTVWESAAFVRRFRL